MTIGTLNAMAAGGAVPIFALLWGDMIDKFKSIDDLVEQTLSLLIQFIIIGVGVMLFGLVMIVCWVVSGERQSTQCKKLYIQSLMRQ